jgi:hypothetical protein
MRGFISPAGVVHELNSMTEEWEHHVFAGALLGMTRDQVYSDVIGHWTNAPSDAMYRQVYQLGWIRLAEPPIYVGGGRLRALVVTATRAALAPGPAWEALMKLMASARPERVELEVFEADGTSKFVDLPEDRFRARRWDQEVEVLLAPGRRRSPKI